MYVAMHSLTPLRSQLPFSLSAQIIMRGPRSAGYGFVALATAEAAEKAVESLNKMELDGRTVIVEIAKPSDQKGKEMKERKKSRRPGRRGAKAIPGEVTEAEANGEASKADGAPVPEPSDAAKLKKKKKKSAVGSSYLFSSFLYSLLYFSGSPGGPHLLRVMPRARLLLRLKTLPLKASWPPRRLAPRGQEFLASPAPPAKPLLASPLKQCSSLLIWVSMLTMTLFATSSSRLVSMLSRRVLFAGAGDTLGRVRVMDLLMLAMKKNKPRVLPPSMTRKLMAAPLSSKLLSMRPRRMKPRQLVTGLPTPSLLSDYHDPLPSELSLLTTIPIFTLPFMFELSSGV